MTPDSNLIPKKPSSVSVFTSNMPLFWWFTARRQSVLIGGSRFFICLANFIDTIWNQSYLSPDQKWLTFNH